MAWHISNALIQDYENSRCSQALVEEFSRGNSLGGGSSGPWKSMPFAPDDSCSDKMKDTCHRSPFGTMYVPSTDGRGKELLTWFLAGFPAQASAPQGKRLELSREIQAASGWTRSESFAKWNPASSKWKTRQHCFIEGLAEFSETWPRWGSMLDGECSDLTQWAPSTSASGRGLWPTPCHGSPRWGGTFQEVGGSKNKLRGTPTGKLYVNPDFWESLMGWPIGWTGTAPLATAKTQEWLRLFGKF